MDVPVIPVLNGILPRPEGGRIEGIFIDPFSASLLRQAGTGGEFMIAPYAQDQDRIYPVGVLARIEDMWPQEVFFPTPQDRIVGLFARIQGRGRLRVRNFTWGGRFIVGQGVELIDTENLRSRGYPTICGAGWRALGGFTEMKGSNDLPVTVYGIDFESGEQVAIEGNLGGSLEPEQAHTIEHAVIRSLQQYALCTPKTLVTSIEKETDELKASIEAGMKARLPEVFGVTQAGACGNPLTNLAQVYLTQEVIQGLTRGQSLPWTLDKARKKTLSRLTEDLRITSDPSWRVMQGLKRGMFHDDTLYSESKAKEILKRFPTDPWE